MKFVTQNKKLQISMSLIFNLWQNIKAKNKIQISKKPRLIFSKITTILAFNKIIVKSIPSLKYHEIIILINLYNSQVRMNEDNLP